MALLLPSCIDYAVCYHAALRLGAVTSGVNPRLGAKNGPRSLASAVDDNRRLSPTTACQRRQLHGGQVIDALRGDRDPQRWLPPDAADPAPKLPKLDPSDPVAIVWTGGSTGTPKGALFDHDNLRAVAAGTDVLSSARRPAPVATPVRPRRLHDEGLGRDLQDDRHDHHPDSMERRARRSGSWRREGDSRTGSPDPVGARPRPPGYRERRPVEPACRRHRRVAGPP